MFRILQLSDLHFGAKCHYSGAQGILLAADLGCALEALDIATNFDAVMLSGDFPWGCHPDGFVQAQHFVAGLLREKIATEGALFAIPGNHDIHWRDPESGKVERLVRSDAEGAFRRFANNIPGHPPVDDRLHYAVCFPEHGILLIALNSARLEHADSQGAGYVGFDQLFELLEPKPENQQYSSPASGYFRIAFVHHHLLPAFTEKLDSVSSTRVLASSAPTRDASNLIYGLRAYGVPIVAHGHLHLRNLVKNYAPVDPQFPALRSEAGVHLCSAGSPSVDWRYCGANHHFQIFEIDTDRNRVKLIWCVTEDKQTGSGRTWARAEHFDLEARPVRQLVLDNNEARLWREKESIVARTQIAALDSWRAVFELVAGQANPERMLWSQVLSFVASDEPKNDPLSSLDRNRLRKLFNDVVAEFKSEFAGKKESDQLEIIDRKIATMATGSALYLHEFVLRWMKKRIHAGHGRTNQ